MAGEGGTEVTLKMVAEALVYDEHAYTLTEDGMKQYDGWFSLRRTFEASFTAGTTFFVLGCLANLVLFSVYLRKPAYASSFRSEVLDVLAHLCVKLAASSASVLLSG